MKIKVRKKKVSVTEGRRFPSSSKGPLKKNLHTYYACMCPLAGQDLGAAQKSGGASQHTALKEAELWAALSTTLIISKAQPGSSSDRDFMEVTC